MAYGGGNLNPSLGNAQALECRGHEVDFWGRPADHDALMERASLVVGHGGHGTTMRALRHGLPIVGIPAMLSDQVPITQLIEQWKVGRGLPLDADVTQIRAAAQDVLADPAFRGQAERRSHAFAGLDGAQLAASSVESLL
jgi:UDP:flavonoid glycosyltransferase YjiC (YdhE family)